MNETPRAPGSFVYSIAAPGPPAIAPRCLGHFGYLGPRSSCCARRLREMAVIAAAIAMTTVEIRRNGRTSTPCVSARKDKPALWTAAVRLPTARRPQRAIRPGGSGRDAARFRGRSSGILEGGEADWVSWSNENRNAHAMPQSPMGLVPAASKRWHRRPGRGPICSRRDVGASMGYDCLAAETSGGPDSCGLRSPGFSQAGARNVGVSRSRRCREPSPRDSRARQHPPVAPGPAT
jgi:hypothetical protein